MYTMKGNVNLDFVLEMTPHHIGGIDMAKSIIKYGTYEYVKKIAENIVTTQSKGVTEMKQLLKTMK